MADYAEAVEKMPQAKRLLLAAGLDAGQDRLVELGVADADLIVLDEDFVASPAASLMLQQLNWLYDSLRRLNDEPTPPAPPAPKKTRGEEAAWTSSRAGCTRRCFPPTIR